MDADTTDRAAAYASSAMRSRGGAPGDDRVRYPRQAIRGSSVPGAWGVERLDEDGACEVAIFCASGAYPRAVLCADRQYGDFDEITLAPYRKRYAVTASGRRERNRRF